jgi:Holliday junction resolvase-like predicted endonuclease
MANVVNNFEAIGLRAVMEFHQYWNELVIQQFYATLEVNQRKEKLIWMTGTRWLEASFSDLAAPCRMDYQHMKEGAVIYDLQELQPEETQGLRYQEASEYGPVGGLRRIPKVMLKLLRRTIMPDDEDYITALAFPNEETIMAIKSGERLDIVEWMVSELISNRQDVDSPLIF